MNFSPCNKVVVIMGATGTGKSRLAIDLANWYNGEIINSDKIQVYQGLDIVTNKVTQEECQGIPHHLLGIMNHDSDYNPVQFRLDALLTIESIIEKRKLPIIAGGSNSFIQSLVIDDPYFTSKYDCCFLWVDEVRGLFDSEASYTQGLRQLRKIQRLRDYCGWNLHCIDATQVFLKQGIEANEAWNTLVLNPCIIVVAKFLSESIMLTDNILSNKDFGEDCNHSSGLNLLATVSVKASEKQEKLNLEGLGRILVIIPMNEKNTIPYKTTTLTPFTAIPRRRRTTHTKPRTTPINLRCSPLIPEKFREKIAEMQGYDLKFVFQKVFYAADLSPSQCRFSMPMRQCSTSSKDEFDAMQNDTLVRVIQPNDGDLDVCELKFSRWDSNKCYVLKGRWTLFFKSIQTDKPLKVGDRADVWYFKIPAIIRTSSHGHGFALVIHRLQQ